MTQVTFSAKARQDLLEIGDYIAKDSRENARRFVGKLIEQCQRIAASPMGYVSREDLAPGLRMAALGRYVNQPWPPTIARARTSPNSRLSFSQCAPPSVLLKICPRLVTAKTNSG